MLPLCPAMFIATASALLTSDGEPSEGCFIPPRRQAYRAAALAKIETEYHPRKRDDHGPRDGQTTAAFIARVGYWSHRQALGVSAWPFSLDADCDALAQAATDRGVLSVATPHDGAILLRWSWREQRFTRASIVVWAADVAPMHPAGWSYDCVVIEGSAPRSVEVTAGASREKLTWVRRVRRRCCPMLGDRFVSWVDLDERDATTRVRAA